MKKIADIIRWSIFGGIIVISIYTLIFFFTHKLNPQYEDCGKILVKSSDEVAIKYGVHTELYLLVDFKKSGRQAVNVNVETYLNHKVGDEVCFNLDEKVSVFYAIKMIYAIILFVIISCILLYYLITFLFNFD